MRSTRTKALRMFLVSIPTLFRSSTVRDSAWVHPSRSTAVALCCLQRDTRPPPKYDANFHPLHRPLHQVSLPGCDGPEWHCVLCGDILDPAIAKFNRSFSSSEKDADREPASAAVSNVATASHSCLLHRLLLLIFLKLRVC